MSDQTCTRCGVTNCDSDWDCTGDWNSNGVRDDSLIVCPPCMRKETERMVKIQKETCDFLESCIAAGDVEIVSHNSNSLNTTNSALNLLIDTVVVSEFCLVCRYCAWLEHSEWKGIALGPLADCMRVIKTCLLDVSQRGSGDKIHPIMVEYVQLFDCPRVCRPVIFSAVSDICEWASEIPKILNKQQSEAEQHVFDKRYALSYSADDKNRIRDEDSDAANRIRIKRARESGEIALPDVVWSDNDVSAGGKYGRELHGREKNDPSNATPEDIAAVTPLHRANKNYRVHGRWFNEDGRQFPGSDLGYMRSRELFVDPDRQTDIQRWKQTALKNAANNARARLHNGRVDDYYGGIEECGCGQYEGFTQTNCGDHGERPMIEVERGKTYDRVFTGEPEDWKGVKDRELKKKLQRESSPFIRALANPRFHNAFM